MVEIREAYPIETPTGAVGSYKLTSFQLLEPAEAQDEELSFRLDSDLNTLISRGERQSASPGPIDYRCREIDLLKLAKHILQTLDPDPVDEILRHLKRIETLLMLKE